MMILVCFVNFFCENVFSGSLKTPAPFSGCLKPYSTVTDFAKLRGLSTSVPRAKAA
ncbi:hypothetical protein [Alysiella filiformis]|uniref:hypothetical protein n=1 Tax=Alysiella filiformis TaxID=194196 RepID=UPI0015C933ED|nr:hypothetical protein [Alysiella filiformis]QMT31783.1 hypothetical protein H3L97_02530 [Alysiella filiformis]UBQ55203.1 hypothetical protein JF568_06150 [Alysiella filiformis DSM 16848]